MAGISHLYDIYKKDPKFVEKLLDSEVEVEEKLDGSRFGFEVKEGNEVKFFKRNDSAPISKIDRTLARYYEKAIGHFESFTEEKLSLMPEGWRFGFEYFPNLVPVKIAYERIPLNHLVLTDITIRDPQGKIIEVITDKTTLDQWADTLECEGPPVVFKGKLSKEQKNKILSFLNTKAEDLEEKFKTENFAAFFIGTLNAEIGKSFMQNSLDKDIEALVFRFDGKNPLKIMNPVYKIFKEEKKQEEKPSDIYSLSLVFLQEFFQELDMKKIKLKGKTFEERYIEFISKTFNLFCKSRFYLNNFQGDIDFELPFFLTREEAKINYKFVTDEETLELLKKSSTNRELFKIMLASMRAHKKKPFGFFKKELIWHHNQLVDKIADYINSGLKESFLSYDEFREVFMINENEQEWEEYGVSKLNEVGFPSYSEVIKPAKQAPPSYLEVLRAIAQDNLYGEDLIGSSVVICDTAPYHNGILAALKDVNEITGKKSILCMIGDPFADMESYKQLSAEFMDQYKNLLHTTVILSRPHFENLKKITDEKKLKIEHLYCNKDLAEDFMIQSGDHSVNHIDSNDTLKRTKVLDYLRDGDLDSYKKLCLPVSHNYFYKLKNDLKNL
jgi:hypothetical protein